MAKILLVEDDKNLAMLVKDGISFENHIVDIVHDGQEGMDVLRSVNYELVILDWDLPKVSGLEILQNLRARGSHTPVLMLTGKNQIIDKERGFQSGADDYLTKPFHIKELSARITALLRRPSLLAASDITVGDLKIDLTLHRVTRNGNEIQLARLEFAVLEFLVRNKGQVFSNDVLLERVWPVDSERSPESVRTLIKKLRNKLDNGGPTLIHNVHGVGYKFEAPKE
ncbi:MAG: response regulator transcription factor [Candidatus Obscuribacterales bacterium]|nr:response regulator transcription factor [Cyanobacteria bacterium SZAS LIN-5]RTL45450.1 MAG: response regulator transcription factor [Candidatus Melainabacteria bacterium]